MPCILSVRTDNDKCNYVFALLPKREVHGRILYILTHSQTKNARAHDTDQLTLNLVTAPYLSHNFE